ncbi:hypothetical protein RIF29_14329 [Crotalaria pallida]|uniref:Uncharacterized protein n=1 Tax=Crotalaria pallida TaxID=3830 RepID=A0AAN9IDN7_CROPI
MALGGIAHGWSNEEDAVLKSERSVMEKLFDTPQALVDDHKENGEGTKVPLYHGGDLGVVELGSECDLERQSSVGLEFLIYWITLQFPRDGGSHADLQGTDTVLRIRNMARKSGE